MPSLRLLSPPCKILAVLTALALFGLSSPACCRSLESSLSTSGSTSGQARSFEFAPQTSVENQTPGGRFVVGQVWDDLKYLAVQPDFLAVLGGISLAPAVFHSGFQHEDPEFTEMWRRSDFAEDFFGAGATLGQATLPIAASAATWGVGKLGGSETLTSFGSDLFRAQAVTGIFDLSLKAAFNRTRPNGAPYSYPSGHSSTAFATAGVVYSHFGPKAGIPAFMLATYVGFSRLQQNKHYLSDVIAGGLLGSFVSLKLGGRRHREAPVSIGPYATGDRTGLSLSVRF